MQAASLTVQGGGQIASTAAGIGRGGDIDIAVKSDIVLTGDGPQITARSTGSGDAGSITVSAANLNMRAGAAISTEATTANGGNITLHIGDFMRLVDSEITTSVQWLDRQWRQHPDRPAICHPAAQQDHRRGGRRAWRQHHDHRR